MTSRYLPVRVVRADLSTTALAAGVHPDTLRRFVELGLVDVHIDKAGRLWFARSAPARIRTIIRLHSDLAVNYAGIALVLDLLERIDDLEYRWTIQLGDTSWT
ncbi:chaperone modulator CbpM [Microbacterium lacticum]